MIYQFKGMCGSVWGVQVCPRVSPGMPEGTVNGAGLGGNFAEKVVSKFFTSEFLFKNV